MSDRNLQKDFDRLIKESFSLHFKPLGFQRKGSTYCRVCENEFIQMINAQKARYNDSESVGFTLNVSFSSGLDDFALPWDRERPICLLAFRLSQVAPSPDWYHLEHNVPFEETKTLFEHHLKQFVLPLFESNKTANSLLEIDSFLHKDGGRSSHGLSRFMLLFHVGERDAAAALLKAEYAYLKQSGCFPPQALDSAAYVAHLHQIDVGEPQLLQRLASYEEHRKKLAAEAARRRTVSGALKVAKCEKNDYPYSWTVG